MKASENKRESLLVLLVIIIGYFVSSLFIYNSQVFIDERNILDPIKDTLLGRPWPAREYPDFPYLFYKYIYLIFNSIFQEIELFSLSRTINCLILPLNTSLFYTIIKRYIRGPFLILACLFFSFSPGIFFSSVAIKTESLTLLEFLLTVFFTIRFLERPERKWAILAGVSAALGLTTKYYVMFPLVFFSGQYLLLGSGPSIFKKIKQIALSKFSHFFVLGYVLSLFATWPSVWHIFDSFSQLRLKNDIYFTEGPTASKAVDEWLAFPFGKYSLAFTYGLPMNVGIIIYFSGLLGILTKKVPKEVLAIFGVPTLAYLLLVLNFTLLRPLYLYTVCAPFFILCSTFYLKDLYQKASGMFKYIVILILIFFPLVEHSNLAVYYHQYAYVLGTVVSNYEKVLAKNTTMSEKDILSLVHIWDYTSIKPELIEKTIMERKPKIIFAHQALFDNFCKYKRTEKYIKICRYFKKLVKGEKGYRIYWKRKVKIPINFLGIDPEYSSDFYILKEV